MTKACNMCHRIGLVTPGSNQGPWEYQVGRIDHCTTCLVLCVAIHFVTVFYMLPALPDWPGLWLYHCDACLVITIQIVIKVVMRGLLWSFGKLGHHKFWGSLQTSSFVCFNTHPKQQVWVWRPKGLEQTHRATRLRSRTQDTLNSCTWEAHGGQKRCRWRGGQRSEVKYSTVKFLRVSKSTAPDDYVS